MRIYVGNFAYEVTEEELRTAFEAFGKVDEVTIVRDRDTGRSKGFAFLEMPSSSESQAAITALNSKEFRGRSITVNEARPRTESGFGGGRSGGGGRFQGGRGGGGGFQNERRSGGGGGGGGRGGPRW
ncbi:MAG: RNA-binding protein [Chloroflexi bacterium]|nr:RNA-binding protein [Chloroflexota bacterium]